MGERGGMDAKRSKDERRCCSECRRKYKPKPSAKKHQKTCSATCRLKRQATQARKRYAAARELVRSQSGGEVNRQTESGGSADIVPGREHLAPEVTRAIAKEMVRLVSAGWPQRSHVERALRRVAELAGKEPTGLAGLVTELPMKSTG